MESFTWKVHQIVFEIYFQLLHLAPHFLSAVICDCSESILLFVSTTAWAQRNKRCRELKKEQKEQNDLLIAESSVRQSLIWSQIYCVISRLYVNHTHCTEFAFIIRLFIFEFIIDKDLQNQKLCLYLYHQSIKILINSYTTKGIENDTSEKFVKWVKWRCK